MPTANEIKKLIEFCETYSKKLIVELQGHQIQHKLNPILITAFWLRIIENFEGIIAVAKKGRPVNAFILIRSMIETYFIMKKCITDDAFYKTYFNKFVKEKNSRLSRVGRITLKTGFDISKEEAEELKRHFEGQIHNDANLGYSIKDLCVEPDDINLYEMVYAHCNLYTHCDAATLDVYIETESDGSYKLVTNNKIHQDATLVCLMSASLFLRCFELYSNFVGHKPINALEFVRAYNEIHDTLKKSVKSKAQQV